MARTGFNKHDISRDACQLFGPQAHQGYDGWWHFFTGYDAETGEAKPSYLMVKAGAWGEDAAQLHRFWGWEQIKVNWDVPFRVEADDCFLTEDHTHGRVKVGNAARHPEWMYADGEMSWSLMSLTFPRPGHWCILHSSAGKRKRRLSGTWSERSSSGRMITDITCEKKDVLLVNYESPDGAKRHKRLWHGGNGVGTIQLFDRHDKLVDRVHAENIGCEYGEYDKLT